MPQRNSAFYQEMHKQAKKVNKVYQARLEKCYIFKSSISPVLIFFTLALTHERNYKTCWRRVPIH